MEYIRSSNLGPTSGSNPKGLDSRIRHMDVGIDYGFEYLGLVPRMVITPETAARFNSARAGLGPAVNMYMHTYVHIYIYILCICTCRCIRICISMCVCMRIHVLYCRLYPHTYTCIHAYTPTCMHTYIILHGWSVYVSTHV